MKVSKDGMPIKEMVAEWLRVNDYDGLCNPYSNCGCGLDDLMPCRCPNERGCVCAYEIPVPEDVDCSRFFSASKSGVVNECR